MVNGIEIVSEPTALQAYCAAHGLDPNGGNDSATPAGDGVSHLAKYAFNMIGVEPSQALTPTMPNSTVLTPSGSAGLPLVSIESSTGKLQITYVRRKATTSSGVTYKLEFSETLALGSWLEHIAPPTSTTSIDTTFERVVFTDSTPFPKRFARVKLLVVQ